MKRERPAVVPEQGIARLIGEGAIHAATPIPEGNIQPASLDLRQGELQYSISHSK